MTHKKSKAEPSLDKVGPDVLALPVPAKSMDSDGSPASSNSNYVTPDVDSSATCCNKNMIEASRRKSERLAAENSAAAALFNADEDSPAVS